MGRCHERETKKRENEGDGEREDEMKECVNNRSKERESERGNEIARVMEREKESGCEKET